MKECKGPFTVVDIYLFVHSIARGESRTKFLMSCRVQNMSAFASCSATFMDLLSF